MSTRPTNPKAAKPKKRAVMKAVKPKGKKCLPGYDEDSLDEPEDDCPDGVTEFGKLEKE